MLAIHLGDSVPDDPPALGGTWVHNVQKCQVRSEHDSNLVPIQKGSQHDLSFVCACHHSAKPLSQQLKNKWLPHHMMGLLGMCQACGEFMFARYKNAIYHEHAVAKSPPKLCGALICKLNDGQVLCHGNSKVRTIQKLGNNNLKLTIC